MEEFFNKLREQMQGESPLGEQRSAPSFERAPIFGGRFNPTLLAVVTTLLFGLVYFYFELPPLNLHAPELYTFVFMLSAVYCGVSVLANGTSGAQDLRGLWHEIKKDCAVPVFLCIALVAVFAVGSVLSSVVLRAGSYRDLLTVTTGDFATDVEEISFERIPMLDKASAQRLGDRKLGELSDMVSQFEVADDYAQMNYRGTPIRVATLEYGDLFKWFGNRSAGLPGYITIDMVTQNVEVVRLEEGIKYTVAEHFSRNLFRHLRFNYPTFMFQRPHFEIDDTGYPWWICPKVEKRIGLFGGTDIRGAVLVDAITGECTYYEDVPTWVDQVYSAELIIEQYDYYGLYRNGFLNSMFGQKGVTVTTTGYNYIALNDDVYMYTGITSVGGDESNIGFILSNQRTKETKYYSCAGAEEYSAMASAQGVVQHLGYQSTFPLLLNVSSQPTYFIALKDNAGLVKMYAMVNVQKYNIVATGSTVAECESNYILLLAQNGVTASSSAAKIGVTGSIRDIRTAVIEGNSYYFFALVEVPERYYVVSAAECRTAVTLNVGDKVTFTLAAPDTTPQVAAGSVARAQ